MTSPPLQHLRSIIPTVSLVFIAVVLGVLAEFIDLGWLGILALLATAVLFLRRIKVGLAEAALLVMVFGSAGFNRSFSRISLPGPFPVFVTELLLAVAATVVTRKGTWRLRGGRGAGVLLVLGAFLGYGTLLAGRGLTAGYGINALKDYSLFYYSAITLLTALGPETGKETKLLYALALGSLAGGAWTVWSFLREPDAIIRYGHVGHSALALSAWMGLVVLFSEALMRRSLSSKLLLSAGVPLLLATIALSGYRTMALVIVVSLGAGAVAARGHVMLRTVLRHVRRWLALGFTLLVVLLVFGNGLGGSYQAFFQEVGDRFERLVLSSGDDNSVQFRLVAWSNAVQEFSTSPVVGIGLGAPAVLYDAPLQGTDGVTNFGDAHNTYLTYLMRTGITGLGLFIALNGVIIIPMFRSLRLARDLDAIRIWALVVMLTSMTAYGVTGLLFESPYLAVQYWALLGLCLSATGRVGASVLKPAPLGVAKSVVQVN